MLLIKNGNVWLGKGAYRPGWDVLCEQDRITAVGPDLAAEGADVIDAMRRIRTPVIRWRPFWSWTASGPVILTILYHPSVRSWTSGTDWI